VQVDGVMDVPVIGCLYVRVDGVMDSPVMQVSVCAGVWGNGSTCNAGVCMCGWMGLWIYL